MGANSSSTSIMDSCNGHTSLTDSARPTEYGRAIWMTDYGTSSYYSTSITLLEAITRVIFGI